MAHAAASRRAPSHGAAGPQPRRASTAERVAGFAHGSASDPGTGRILRPLAEPSLQAVDGLTAESLALCITSDVRPLAGLAGYVDWRLCGRLSALIRAGVITGARGESVLVSTQGALHTRRVFVFGWGERSAVEEDAPAYFEQIARALVGAGCDSVAFAMPEPGTRLLHLVEDHVRKALGARCVAVFGPDPILAGAARASSSAPATPLQPTRAHALPA